MSEKDNDNIDKDFIKDLVGMITTTINDSIEKYLPNISKEELEENGSVYYMNSKNGTEFDWYVNSHLPNFMVFYNDKQNMGAVKLSLYMDGKVSIYIYGDCGTKLIKQIETFFDIDPDKLFILAVLLKIQADDKQIWDARLDKIDFDARVSDMDISRFRSIEKYMESAKNKMKIFNQMALVSKKILDDGWKVGFMYRDEVHDEIDSGWNFLAGNEDDAYLENNQNVAFVHVYDVYRLDPIIFDYIDNPINSEYIRVSPNEFVIDDKTRPIYTDKVSDENNKESKE